MTAETNKQLIRTAFEALGRSDIGPLTDLMTEDFAWITEGQSSFSRRFDDTALLESVFGSPGATRT